MGLSWPSSQRTHLSRAGDLAVIGRHMQLTIPSPARMAGSGLNGNLSNRELACSTLGGAGGSGIGMLSAVAPAPMPPSQVLGGAVPTPRVEGVSAAQNMNPSIPAVVPAPFGAADWTHGATAVVTDHWRSWCTPGGPCCSRRRSERSGEPSPERAAALAGCTVLLPSMCSCQLLCAVDADGCRAGTIALAKSSTGCVRCAANPRARLAVDVSISLPATGSRVDGAAAAVGSLPGGVVWMDRPVRGDEQFLQLGQGSGWCSARSRSRCRRRTAWFTAAARCPSSVPFWGWSALSQSSV